MFDLFKKKKQETNNETAKANTLGDESYRIGLLQTVVNAMAECHILDEPVLIFNEDADKGFDAFYRYYTNHPFFVDFAEKHPSDILWMSAGQEFGAGIFMLYWGFAEYSRKLRDLTEEEMSELFDKIGNENALALGMKTLDIAPDSQNMQVIQSIFAKGIEYTEKTLPELQTLDDNFRIFCWVFYNAGFSFMIRMIKNSDKQ